MKILNALQVQTWITMRYKGKTRREQLRYAVRLSRGNNYNWEVFRALSLARSLVFCEAVRLAARSTKADLYLAPRAADRRREARGVRGVIGIYTIYIPTTCLMVKEYNIEKEEEAHHQDA